MKTLLQKFNRTMLTFLGTSYTVKQLLTDNLLYIFLGSIGGICIIIMSPFLFIAMCAGIFMVIVSIMRVEIALLTIIVCRSSIVFESALPLVPIPFGSLQVPDILLAMTFFMIIYRLKTDSTFNLIKTPLNTPLFCFYISVLISAIISISALHIDYTGVMRNLRLMTYYLCFFVVVNLIREKKQVYFMIYGLFAIAVFVSIIMIIQSIIGESIQFFPGRIENASTFGIDYEARRILPPGQTLVYFLLLTSMCYAVTTQRESFVGSGCLYMIIGLLSIGTILTYNRNYWISAIVSMSILFIIEKGKVKRRILLMCVILFLVLSAEIYLLSMYKGQSNIMSAVSNRFISLFTGDKLYNSESLEYRYNENYYAIIKIWQYPFFGSGIGTDYIPSKYLSDDLLRVSGYIHNGYLWILLNFGGIGFISFIIFYLHFIVRGFIKMKGIKDEFLRSSIIGFTLSGLSMLPIALVNPVFSQWFSVVVIFMIIGLVEAIIQVNDKEANEGSVR